MPDSDSAQWILEAMTLLHSPDAELVRDLLQHMATLRVGQSVEVPRFTLCFPQSRSTDLLAGATAEAERELELQLRRKALQARLRDHWQKAKCLPCCLKQAQVLKETALFAIHSQILLDPLAEDTATPLTLEQAKHYACRAVEIAEEVGDWVELIEAYVVLGHHHKLTAAYEEARLIGLQALALAEKIRSLRHQIAAYKLLYELLTLTDPGPNPQIHLLQRQIEVLEKQGDTWYLAHCREMLAKFLIFTHDLTSAAEELQKTAKVIGSIPSDENSLASTVHIRGSYHRCLALLHHAQGLPAEAVEDMKTAMAYNTQSQRYREYAFLPDLAFLETLYLNLGDEAGFAAFCQDVAVGPPARPKYWHLSPEIPPHLSWDVEDLFPGSSLAPRWHWIDPLQKGAYSLGDALGIAPVMGTGFLSNVYAPRLMLDVSGDFTFETILDCCRNLTRAGGILVYQDDNTLIRYGVGIHFDGEITLTAKSPEQGFFVVGRGLLAARQVALRLARQGDCFRAWCSDGTKWYSCGHTEVKMNEQIQVGLFAECTYRDWFSPTRCTATPVRFAAARLRIGYHP